MGLETITLGLKARIVGLATRIRMMGLHFVILETATILGLKTRIVLIILNEPTSDLLR